MSKRMTRVLSLILTLVMFVSVSTPAFAWGGGDMGGGWDREIGEGDFRDFNPAEEVEEEEEEFDYFQTDGAEGFQVTVEAPMGSLPTLAELRAEPVEVEDVREAVESVVEGKANILVAMDISFWMNGVEIEPEEPVRVKISAPELDGKSNLTVVHIPDADEPETVDLLDESELSFTLGANEVAFRADSFSVYAVIDDGSTGDNARVEVNFYNGDTLIETMYVKTADLSNDDVLAQILYDPGAGTIPEGQMFIGWTTKQNYTVDDVDSAMTIEKVRTAIKATTITEGMAPINYYAMFFTVYTVTYLDELGVVIRKDTLYTMNNESYGGYVVDEPYTPRNQDAYFEGWHLLNDQGVAVGEPIPRGTAITVDKSINLMAGVPNGNWLIFEANGEDASYTGPQFLEKNELANKPSDPTRLGYDFAGWYRNPEGTGATFDFENEIITVRTTLYAKWTPHTTANYAVIIWKENVDGATYDFAESYTFTGTVGQNCDVSANGSGDNRYAIVGGTDIRYTGFHLKEFDQNVKIATEGNAVVNVYYERTTYTLTFRVWHILPLPPGWKVETRIIAKYGQNISGHFPVQGYNGRDTNCRWEPQNGTTFDRVIVFIDTMPAENVTFNRDGGTFKDDKTMWLYQEALPGETGDISRNGKQFKLYKQIDCKYNFFTEAEDYPNLVGFYKDADFAPEGYSGRNGSVFTGKQNNAWENTSVNHLVCYYLRESYPITYNDGQYVTGRNVPIKNRSNVNLGNSELLLYNSDITSYNRGGVNYKSDFTPESGFVFEGWYLDKNCTREAVFNKMPQGGITVYAKWRQIEYRVFLHPMVPDKEVGYDIGNQATSFRLAFNGKIRDGEEIPAKRTDYELIGWYMDEDFSQPFNSSIFVMNDQNSVPYEKTEDTETDKYGTATEHGNKDAQENRFWITRKLDLYAKWRSKLDGAKGITVVFDADAGTFAGGATEWKDPSVYLDRADGVGAAAPTPNDSALVFKHWILQHYDAESGKFVETETTVLPGENFTVLKADAKVSDIPEIETGVNKEYLVKLVAVYGAPEEETLTSITWYSNVQDVANNTLTQSNFTGATTSEYTAKGYFVSNENININEAVDIKAFDTWTYPGYHFLGWAKSADATADDLFLKWVEEVPAQGETPAVPAHFETEDGDTVTQVAADDLESNEVFAIWEAGFFYVYHSSNNQIEEFSCAELMDGVFDITSRVASGYLYGGYYLEDGVSIPEAVDDVVPAYDGSNWAWNTPQTASGKTLTPAADTVYYLKEVPNGYLKPYTQYTYYKTEERKGEIDTMWFITATDDLKYDETGFRITVADPEKPGKQIAIMVKTLTIKAENNPYPLTLTAPLLFRTADVKAGYLGYVDITAYMVKEGTAVFQQYWVTPDGVTVFGNTQRTLSFGNLTITGLSKDDAPYTPGNP